MNVIMPKIENCLTRESEFRKVSQAVFIVSRRISTFHSGENEPEKPRSHRTKNLNTFFSPDKNFGFFSSLFKTKSAASYLFQDQNTEYIVHT